MISFRRLMVLCALAIAVCAQPAKYPSEVVTTGHLKVAKDNVRTMLRSPVYAGDTVIHLRDASKVEPNMQLTIGEEILNVTAVSGNYVTVERAFNGSVSPKQHNAGSAVGNYWTAWDKNAVAAEIIAIQQALGPNLSNVDADAYQVGGYIWSQQPGGTLTGGIANVVTVAPCPRGVAGTNPDYYVRLAGGTGTAESVLVSGGTCTSGAASGTLIFTPSFSHSGAWSISSASGGAQEALCALPASGGSVEIAADLTLYANVETCGKTAPRVVRRNGVTVSGSFTILGGGYSSHAHAQVFNANAIVEDRGAAWDWNALAPVPSSRMNPLVVYNGSTNVYPLNYQNGASLGAGALFAVDIPATASGTGFLAGISGMARSQNGIHAVGVYGEGRSDGSGSVDAVFGSNLLAIATVPTNHVIGEEIDLMNSSAGTQNIVGSHVASAVTESPASEFAGYLVSVSMLPGSKKWNTGLHIRAGSVVNGGPGGGAAIRIGAAEASGTSQPSLPIQFNGFTAAGSAMISDLHMEPSGQLKSGTPIVGGAHQLIGSSVTTTPTFDAAVGSSFGVYLDGGSVTSSTLTNAIAGQTLTFILVQPPAGGRTFAWPGNFRGGMVIDAGSNKTSVQQFYFDGTTAYAANGGTSF